MRPGGTSRVPPPEHASEILPEHMPEGLLSIAVFGPGKGEAIVVRLPDGRKPNPPRPGQIGALARSSRSPPRPRGRTR